MSNIVYRKKRLEISTNFLATTLILAVDKDMRAMATADYLVQRDHQIARVLVLTNEGNEWKGKDLFPNADIRTIHVTQDQLLFVSNLKGLGGFLSDENILIDISCIRIPHIFLLLKYLNIVKAKVKIEATYSVPFEYTFSEEPFTSYRSYYGDLKTSDLLGFSGISEGRAHSKLILFLGFEGMLSSKIVEDIQYESLVVVNGLPSLYAKYKDVSVVNNYDLLSDKRCKMVFVPADNPFEVYNALASEVLADENVCIAPLSTKPVALGVCMYALLHHNVRVVFPMSDRSPVSSTCGVHCTHAYGIDFPQTEDSHS